MELGGNIELVGFDSIDKSKLVVVKKLVGHSVREMAEKSPTISKVRLTLSGPEDSPDIKGEVIIDDQPIRESCNGTNLFFVLDSVMKNLIEKLE